MDDYSTALKQRFVVTVDWSAESGGRVTEGDIREAIEQMVLELDEDAVVEVNETVDGAE